jgi:hypothetical protein
MPSLNTGNAILSNAIAVNSSYNVGIGGAASGSFKLQVTGTTNLTGALTGTSATFSGILAETKTADGIIQTIGGNETKANIYQFTSGGLAGAVFNIGHNFYYDGTNYGQGNASKSGWVISSNLNADSFAIGRAAAGSTSAPTTILSFASTGAATFSSSISTGTLSLSGGTIQSSGDYYIGTNNANFIQFYTSNQNRMIITSGGNVGIGTTNPTYQLQVSSASGGLISLNSTVTNTFRGIVFQNNAASDSTEYAYIKYNATSGEMRYYANPAAFGGYTTFYSNNTESMRITSAGIVCVAGTSQLGSTTLSVFGSIAARNAGVDATFAEAFTAYYSANNTESNAISTAVSSAAGQSGFRFDVSNGAGSAARTASMYIYRTSVSIVGSLSKGSGTFKIDHPLESKKDTHHLVHSFIEGPRVDLIYRGKVTLVDGTATINIDQSAGMTEGTFATLNRDIQCFTTNESGWDLVKGKVEGNILTITSNNSNSTDEISWMVIGERQDKHIKDTDWTDENGKPILEPLKTI